MKINHITIDRIGLASFRYHVATPAKELLKMGHEVFVSDFPKDGCEAYVFRKHLRVEEIDLIKLAKHRNPSSKTYFIVCDYHLDNRLRDHYLAMIYNADRLVVCTDAMRKVLLEETGKDSTVIKDPWGVEYEKVEPDFKNKKSYSLLWFGSRTNIYGIKSSLPYIGDNKLVMLTDQGYEKDREIETPNISFRYATNMPVALKEEMTKADIVVIPQDHTDKRRNVKSHNRLVDSIRMGKFVIASPIDAYLELKDYCFIGSIKDGLEWLKEQPEDRINDMIRSGQRYIETEFSPQKIGKKWHDLFVG